MLMVIKWKFYVTVVTGNKCWKLFSADKGVINGFMNVSFSSAREAADSTDASEPSVPHLDTRSETEK
jgi:hypothetical protein